MNWSVTTAMPMSRRRFAADIAKLPLEKFKLPVLLTLAHLPLGILLYRSSVLALLHPLLVFLFGLRRAWQRQEKLERVVPFVIYIVGAEVLWRMAKLPIPWEAGKYASMTIMFVALARRGCWKIPTLPLLYLLLLLPACLLTVFNNDYGDARAMLSSNMSGPCLLFVSCWFCSHLKLTRTQIKTLFFLLIIVLASVAVTTLFYTVTAEEIRFNTESNHATSGGFGPNQVSAMLGMGAFFCIAACLLFKNRFLETIFLGFFAILFTAQSMMTFSRGGMYNALGAVSLVAIFQMLDPADGFKRLLSVVGAGLIFALLVFPVMNEFTGGTLEARFQESDVTNRGTLITTDLEVFFENPIFGVGVGESYLQYQKILHKESTTHTEFSRVLSEHGLFGVLALICLVLMLVGNLIREPSGDGKALIAGLFAWGCLFMMNAGMRLAAPAFLLGLTFLTIRKFPPVKRIVQKKVLPIKSKKIL